MARVVPVGNLVQLTGGAANFDLAATSVKHLFELLAERHPPWPHTCGGRGRGHRRPDLPGHAPRAHAPDSEVFILPQIAGG